MTRNRRIFLNIIATYGRTLYSVAIGLFTGRWVLQALGHVDYGLLGLIGGLNFLIVYLNNMIVNAVIRYYGLAVGEERTHPKEGLEHAQMWFTTAVVIETVVPAILFLIGYPIGEWAIRHYLTIPPDRVAACLWVYRFTCFSCFLGLSSIPMNAMYGAHQYIAELTVYGFVCTTINFFVIYYMVNHPAVWLVKWAFWNMLLGIIPTLIIDIRAFYLFPECRFRWKYARCWGRIKELFCFTFWNAWGSLGGVLRGQGVAIIQNKYFGPTVNAAMAVGSGLSGNTLSLSSAVTGAFSPEIANSWGAGDFERAKTFALRSCKLGALLILIFAIPLSLEADNVLHLWLKTPPDYAAGFCLLAMFEAVVQSMTSPYITLVNCNGKIALYQAVLGTFLVLATPVAWIMVVVWGSVYAASIGSVCMMLFCAFGRVFFAQNLIDIHIKRWFMEVFSPLVFLALVTFALGWIPSHFYSPSFVRVCLTTAVTSLVMLPMSWFWIMSDDEREILKEKFAARFRRV